METYFDSKEKYKCYGCKACEQICPTISINMKSDNEGFWYPIIDKKRCIDCKLCLKVCPYNKKNYNKNTVEKPMVIAAINKNEDIRLESSSGGIFTSISNYIIDKGGVVFGVELNEDKKVVHTSINDKSEIYRFRGSKYVQSDINICYKQVKNLLEDGRLVLFTGTPCQIAGLNSFLRKDYLNLYTCDIVCHGVPSPKIFKDYVDIMEKKYKSNISELKFRDKSNGWKICNLKIDFYNLKQYKKDCTKDKYYTLFYSHRILRPSCHQCRFSSIKREADITLGDFWGIENHKPKMFDNKGTSLLLVNTEKGQELLDNIKKDIVFEECSIDEAMQPNLKKPTKPSLDRKKFFEDYNKRGLRYVLDVYTGVSFKERVRGKIRRYLKI